MRLSKYRVLRKCLRFWLEWDRGTMNARELLVKFALYTHYIASRQWARECSMPPALLCIAPDIVQERRLIRIARMRLTHIPELVLWTTTEVLLNEHGPIAGIWLQHFPRGSQEGQSGSWLMRKIFAMDSRHIST